MCCGLRPLRDGPPAARTASFPMPRIEADTEVGNIAERRATETAGFTCEGVLRSVVFPERGRRDLVRATASFAGNPRKATRSPSPSNDGAEAPPATGSEAGPAGPSCAGWG